MKTIDEIALSDYGRASTVPSPVSRMMSEFAFSFRDGIDINLGVGYVNESTIPSKLIEGACIEVINNRDRYRAVLNYGGSKGSQNLIDSIRRYYLDNKIGGIDEGILSEKEIIIGANGATSLLDSVSQIVRKGIVITSDPLYYIYTNMLTRAGFEILAIPEDGEGLRTDILRTKLTELGERRKDISFLYLVTINNPTCTITTNDRRREIVEIITGLSIELKRKVPVIFDKAYEDIIHDPSVEKPKSGIISDEIGIVYEVGTLSKLIAPALRVGYMIGPPGEFMDVMVQRTNDVGLCPSSLTSDIASYLLDNHIGDQLKHVNNGYKRRASAVKELIGKNLGDFISECKGGQAGFYFYITFLEGIRTDESSGLFKFLGRVTKDPKIDGPPDNIKPRVIYIPGQLCVHQKGDMIDLGLRQMRISYGFEEPKKIEEALAYFEEYLRSRPGDPQHSYK
ncbi:MAG: pyridoxal phosphate-dependent aminotransferase [Halobacteriota archaeon]|nr:pyridoxal phosphate-dependent aminotransferase [Halobacteriota archaeon]